MGRTRCRQLGAALVLTQAVILAQAVAKPAEDALVEAGDWQLAARHCGACHGYALVTAQRGDAAFWLDLLRWMQREQGLWPIPEDEEARLVAYLAQFYSDGDGEGATAGPGTSGRRPALAPWLMPAQDRSRTGDP